MARGKGFKGHASARFESLSYCTTCVPLVTGLLGVAYVDLFQSWRIVERPWRKLGYTILQSCGFLLVGTIPFIDNWVRNQPALCGLLLL